MCASHKVEGDGTGISHHRKVTNKFGGDIQLAKLAKLVVVRLEGIKKLQFLLKYDKNAFLSRQEFHEME